MFGSSETTADMSSSRSNAFLQPNPRNQGSVPNLKSSGSDIYIQGGLARYRSAPSSFLATLLDSSATDNSSSGDESEAIFSALMNHQKTGNNNSNSDGSQKYRMKQEEEGSGLDREPRPGFPNGQTGGGYESAVSGDGGAIVGSYSVGMETEVNGSNLMRQSSSPAGFFTGFSGMTNHMSFSSGPSASSRFMPSIPENGNESIGTRNPEHGQMRSGNAAYGQASWSGSTFSGLKRNREGEVNMFSSFGGLEHDQSAVSRKTSPGLVHHLSLPKSFAEAADTEKYLQFQQDTVPCQVRAKRGCATHPRSIAERMRRTRISERMKKLQDLFPNMDKQTNTADMLDLAVEYIKDLQKQVQTLTETRAKCVCSNQPQQMSPSS